MDSISICTINIHGLRNGLKRKTFFHKMKLMKWDIICIQESYITDNDVEQWEREWGRTLLHTSATTHSKGQIILIKKHFPYDFKCITKTERILSIEIQLEDKELFIANVYAPNDPNEKKHFFKVTEKYMRESKSNYKIVCGDFNCVVDNDLDIISGNKHNTSDVALLKKLLIDNELLDLWRLTHAEEKEYTWCKKSPFIARRLDYVFVTESVLDNALDCEIKSIAQTDHRLIGMRYNLTHIKRGPSYWKFNDSLLHDTLFADAMNTFLHDYECNHHNDDPCIKWDICKVKIKDFCIQFSKQKAQHFRSKIKELQANLNDTDKKLSAEPNNVALQKQREKIMHELELQNIQEAKSAQIRSREKFIAEGEKNTRYFLNLEKARANTKVMDRLVTADGITITSQKGIMKEQVKFYRNIFSRKGNFNENEADMFTRNIDIPQISDEQKNTLDREMTPGDFGCALKDMKNGSAPGIDGLTTSFIKFFWLRLKNMIVNSFKHSFKTGEMSTLQKRAVITLIHKGKDLPRDTLNNWRPISLTNTDYKILAKCLAHRLSSVIADVVSEDQVGFIKGRNSSKLIRLIDDTIDFMNNSNKPGILLALDYSRAFDSISKEYILWTFKKFGFGNNFLNWVKLLTNNTESRINYMGWISEKIAVNSGIRQGCPFSPMAFVLSLEILAIKIRNNESIEGIILPNITGDATNTLNILKLAMYADDVTLFLKDQHDLERVMQIIDDFSVISYLKMNKNKTEAMWLGSMKNSTDEFCNVQWKTQLKILGIYFKNNTPASEILENWTKRLEQVDRMIIRWSKRNLSISGKLCIIKTFLISQFVYPMQALCAPTQILQKLNTTLLRYLWKKKYSNTKAFEKVKRTVMCNTVEEGGISMINIHDMQLSFMLSWAANLQKTDEMKWKCIPKILFDKLGRNLSCFKSNSLSKTFVGLDRVKSKFWKQVLCDWLDHKALFGRDLADFNHQCLWNNLNIRYRKKVLFFDKWIQANVIYVKDIWSEGDILSFDQMCKKVGYSPTLIFEYNAMHTALRALALHDLSQTANTYSSLNIVTKNTTPRIIRMILTKAKVTSPCSSHFWLNKYNLQINKNYWLLARNSTTEERLRLLQWKILHNIYPTNILLEKINIKENNLCSYCQKTDYIEHFFWSCEKLIPFWCNVVKHIYYHTGEQVSLSETVVLFGYMPDKQKKTVVKIINHIILIAKMAISKFKYGNKLDLNIVFERELNIRIPSNK